MSTLIVSVRPISDLDEPVKARSKVVVHYREILFEDDNSDIISREASLSFDVSPEFIGQIEILDYVPETSINLSLTSSQGMLILSKDVDRPGSGATNDDFVEVWELDETDIEKVKRLINRTPLYPSILNRQGNFISIGFPAPPFFKYKLMISPIRQTEISEETVAKLFNIERFGTAAKRLRVDDLPELANLPLGELISTKISIKGQFEFSVPVDGDETGWIWLLNGPIVFIGIQDEENLDPIATRRSILLPPPSGDSDEDGETASDIPIGGVDSGSSSGVGLQSIDVSEEELLSNPDIFNDDPGTFCRPFSNPHRIVSERTFHTILRVEQPTVGSKPYIIPDPPGPDQTFVGTTGTNVAVAEAAPAPSSGDDVSVGDLSDEPAEFIGEGMRATRATASSLIFDTASTSLVELDPGIKIDPGLFKTYIAGYSRKVPRGRFVLNANQPLNWEGNSTEYQATSLAFGHILETRVQTRTNGHSLGPVAHTMTLAPRQTKRIVTIQSGIADRIQRVEDTDFAESVETGTDREYSYQNQVESHLSEWSRGGSVAAQAGGAGGVGGFINGVLFGGGGAFGIGASGSTQKGGRDIAAQENQNLQDSIRTFGDSLRKLDSMVVIDQSQEEFVQGVSEIVRNINYCHSLTIIYHEILHHLRVDTRIVGARECVFVPFEIKPFTIARTLKWRDTIRRILRRRDLRWVMRYLPDALVNFVGSAIPDERRSDIPITNISGSIYIQLKIERPRDSDAGEYIEDNWETLLPFTVDPIFGIFSFISTLLKEKKDDAFQSKYAPKIATNWANNLIISREGDEELKGTDFTLVSSYRFGRTVRIDFSLSDDTGTLTRSNLKNIKVKAPALPIGSIANVKQIRFRYYTEHFDYQVSSPHGTDDLIVAKTGKPEADGATVYIPTKPWEEVNLQDEIKKAVAELLVHLDEYTEYYHKMIWWNLDRDKLYMMLDGIKLSPEDETSVASVVERNPLAVVGNALVYRVAAGAFIGVDGHQDADSLNYHYRDTNTQAEPIRISLPTSGLYAQSIMDECEACEEHFGSTEWVLTNDEPELAELGPQLLASRRANLPDATPSDLPDSIINIQNAATPPAPSGFADTLNALTNPNSFRDMAGLEGTQANARAAMETAAELAAKFGSEAAAIYKAQLSAKQAKEKMAVVKKAHQDGSIDNEERKKQDKKILDVMNKAPANSTSKQDVVEMADAANKSDVDIEVKRPSGEQVKIRRSRSNETGTTTDTAPPSELTEVPPDDAALIRTYVEKIKAWHLRVIDSWDKGLEEFYRRMNSASTQDADTDILGAIVSSLYKNGIKEMGGALISNIDKPLGVAFKIVHAILFGIADEIERANKAKISVAVTDWVSEQLDVIEYQRNIFDKEKVAETLQRDLEQGYKDAAADPADLSAFMSDVFVRLYELEQLTRPINDTFEIAFYEQWINAHFTETKGKIWGIEPVQNIQGCIEVRMELQTLLDGDGYNITSTKVVAPNEAQVADGLNLILKKNPLGGVRSLRNILELKTHKVICFDREGGGNLPGTVICGWLNENNEVISKPKFYLPGFIDEEGWSKLSEALRSYNAWRGSLKFTN